LGFSTVAVNVIIFAGLLFMAGVVANAVLEAQRDTAEAERDKEARDQMRRSTELRLEDAQFQGNRLNVYLMNVGDSVLEVAKIQVMIDGDHSPGTIGLWEVDGSAWKGYWAPGQELYLRIDTQPEPNRVYIVTETGVGVTVIP
jgi:archaellum component FlaF (FlaF/FlaG flagellin family)